MVIEGDTGLVQDELRPPTSVIWASAVENSFGSIEIIRDDLMLSVQAVLPPVPMIQIVNDFISLFMQYTFPMSPIIHEATVRANASIYFPNTASRGLISSLEVHHRVHHMRAFTLITAVCASVASVLPESLLPHGRIVAVPFFPNITANVQEL
jgi:hypothetical protein